MTWVDAFSHAVTVVSAGAIGGFIGAFVGVIVAVVLYERQPNDPE